MTIRKMKFAWKYRRPLWKYRKLLAHRHGIAAAAIAGAAILVLVIAAPRNAHTSEVNRAT